MEKYIALLRGVNVGGNNKVSMPLLREAFKKAGFSEVSTYINSGNILFSSVEKDEIVLQQRCRQIIKDEFRLDIAVAVLSAKDLSEALRHAPDWWDGDPESKHNAIFVVPPARAGNLVEEVGIKPEYENLFHYGQVIFWSAPLKTFSRTRWSKVVGSAAYGNITIRNANTAKKLLHLSGGSNG